MATKIKDNLCPFCGAVLELCFTEDLDAPEMMGGYFIDCKSEKCLLQIGPFDTPEEALRYARLRA